MSHMVIFRTSEGKAAYHQAEALDEAVRFVERIRNEESVDQARIFRLEEVVFEYRPYYRVELTGASARSDGPASTNGAEAPADADGDHEEDSSEHGDDASAEAESVPSSGGRKGGIFSR